MIYLDNAATSWPKPPQVIEAMTHYLRNVGGSPGRSGHPMSVEAGRIVYNARELIAELFHAPDPMRVIFTPNATFALNLAIRGLLRPGDRAVTTACEHNSAMRPLRALEREGVTVAVARCGADGRLDLSAFESAAAGAKLAVINWASNVLGTIQDVEQAARIARKAGALTLVDAAQAAGALSIDVGKTGIDLLAFTGHKCLMGPTGAGGLVIGPDVDASDLRPLVLGGTGSNSGSEEQPERLPDRFEGGTPNAVGTAGLAAGVRFLMEMGIEQVRQHHMRLTQALIEGLSAIERVRVHGPRDAARTVAVVSFTVDGLSVSEAGMRLAEEFGIMCRVGLHCAPAAHRTAGTFPEGTVRFAPGVFNTASEMEQAVDAVRRIALQ